MTTAQENLAEETSLADRVAAVEAGRAEGLSIAAACRAAGLSTSTYYRRRRRSTPLASLAGLPDPAAGVDDEVPAPDAMVPVTGWPFTDETPRAPFFWDTVFADELSDSFVRRTFGSGQLERRSAGHALSVLAEIGPQPLRRLRARSLRLLARFRDSAMGLIALAALTGLAGWAVASAADPAAWLRPADLAQGTTTSSLTR